MSKELRQAANEFADYLQSARGYSKNTVKAYETDVLDLVEFAAKQSVTTTAQLELDLVRDWLYDADQRGLTKSTIARKSAAIRSFSAWLAKTV